MEEVALALERCAPLRWEDVLQKMAVINQQVTIEGQVPIRQPSVSWASLSP